MTNLLRKAIEKCNICGGTGVIPTNTPSGLSLEECSCIKEVAKEISLIQANIPKRYQDFDWRHLRKKFKEKNEVMLEKVKKYIDNIDSSIKNGRGLWFQGPPGAAKSAIISYTLKVALEKGHSAYFSKASHILDLRFEAMKDDKAKAQLYHILHEVDILALEEIEKVYLTASDSNITNQLFYDFVSDVYDSGISLLISTNLTKKEIVEKFPNFITDRLSCLELITLNIDESGKRGKSALLEEMN